MPDTPINLRRFHGDLARTMGALEPFSNYQAVQQDDAITLTWDEAPPRYELVTESVNALAVTTPVRR